MEGVSRDSIRPSATAEEEAFKGNTDCVYFLASPLTCKKGADCEYRHSESARVNPRDCWFWLNGNCLNPKCSFRHPPVDGLVGTPTAHSVTDLPKQAATPAQLPASHAPAVNQNPTKQTVPCYYFQNGGCLKGDRCAFTHVLPPIINSILQQAPRVAKPVSEQPSTFKKTSWSLNKSYTEQSNSKITADQQVKAVTSSTKHISESGVCNGFAAHNKTRPSQLEIEIVPRSQPSNISVHNSNASSRPLTHKSLPLDDLQHDRDAAADLLHESSPGFDVLVDNENEDIEHLHNESEFDDNSGHDKRSPGRIKDFEYYKGFDHNNAAKEEQYDETGDYDCQARGHYFQERYRTSNRISDRPFIQEKRPRKMEGPVDINGSDLRHRLKQRRLNGSKTTSPDRCRNYKGEQRSADEHRKTDVNSHKNAKYFHHEGSLSKRLQGRITLRGKGTASSPSDSYSGGDMESGRNGSRASPGRPVNYHGRIHDRLHRRTQENSSEARNSGLSSVRRDNVESQLFSGPKSHAELKGSSIPSVNLDQRPSRNNSGSLSREQKSSRLEKALGGQNDESMSFEGPMSLSDILERKRGLNSGNHTNSAGERDSEEKVGTVSNGYNNTAIAEMYTSLNDIKEPEAGAEERQEEGLTIEDGCELDDNLHAQSSARGDILDLQNDLSADNMEDLEIDNYEEGDVEYEYEEGEDYKIDDDEDAYHEGHEDLNDEDDGNDFAMKLGVEYA